MMPEGYMLIDLHVNDLLWDVVIKLDPGRTDKGTLRIVGGSVITVEVFLEHGEWYTHLTREDQEGLDRILTEQHIARARASMLKEEAQLARKQEIARHASMYQDWQKLERGEKL